jgi:LysM repeat protein
MTQLDTAREIWQRLTAAGVSKGVTAGLLGNMQAESAIIADRWEGDRVGNLSGGYGLVQWTPATKYRDWAKARGMDPAALSSQITRIIWERDNNVQFARKGQTFAQWAASNITPEQAADDFVRYYERPAVINSGTRQQFARKWYDELSGTTPAKQTPAASGPAGSVDDLARQVINGQWGNGDDRKRRLGARYAEVQARVNQLVAAGSKPAPPPARSYIVKSGDTLSRIADRHGTTWQTLAKINNLANPDLIHPGQTIRLP